jgi:apolipoprotein N-acyltransferase
MQDVVSTAARVDPGRPSRMSIFIARVGFEAPSLATCALTLVCALLLILSFPDFDLWPLAWLALSPLFVVIARRPRSWPAFLLGWLFGTSFFYGSCYWLTYSIIHTAGISPWIAFPLLLPGAVVLGVFPAFFALVLARAIERWGGGALVFAPLIWTALEWTRLQTTGQLWNATGYSQAYHVVLIQAASVGGVYAISFLIVSVNAALGYMLLRRTQRALLTTVAILLLIAAALSLSARRAITAPSLALSQPDLIVIAVQPNVPVEPISDSAATAALMSTHFSLSKAALEEWERDARINNILGPVAAGWTKNSSPATRRAIPRLVIWPESPMNFAYGTDNQLREKLAEFSKANDTAMLFNSQEVAPNDGIYNSALLINEEGKLVAQYDKIRLLPFGEYVPLPQWLPGTGLIRGIVGDFTPGTQYRLLPIGKLKAGVFICIESAYPAIARQLTTEGADVLVNISNDGYLGPTAVMRQHLANAVFRAVENGRPVLRVTNTGITAFITPMGELKDTTQGFKPDVRIWATGGNYRPTFYAKHGDWFAVGCAVLSLLIFVVTLRRSDRKKRGDDYAGEVQEEKRRLN